VVIESWPRHYNTERPNGSLGYEPPAPEVFTRRFLRTDHASPKQAAKCDGNTVLEI